MTARTLLLTGCDGFIGRHVARAARESGWRVVGVTRSLQPVAEVDERVLVDLNAAGAEEALVSAMEGATAIVHAAARVQLFGRAAPVIAENLKVTGKVIRAAERAGRPRLVFLSSASVLFERREQRGLMDSNTLPTGNSAASSMVGGLSLTTTIASATHSANVLNTGTSS